MAVTSTYLLDYLPIEVDRLVSMARTLAPEVRGVAERAGLRAGGRAIDLGCGPAGALLALREVVGADGAVVGVDANPAALDTAQEILARVGFADVELVVADINEVDAEALGAGTFDLAFSRLVLMHQPDPARTLSMITKLVRPGGAVVAFDMLRPPLIEPSCGALDRAWELLAAGMQHLGAHPDTSRRYTDLATSAGLEVVSQRGVFFPVPPIAAIGETTGLLRAASTALTSSRLATAEEIECILHDLEAAPPALEFATTPFAVELIARKPA